MNNIPIPPSEQTIVGDENVQVIGGQNFIQKIYNFLWDDKFQIAQRNRRAMLKLVKSVWIKGVLQKSLYRETLLELGLEERLGAVERPWDMQLQMPDRPNQTLPPHTSIIQVFDDVNGSLLILGEPGSGKTTALLELARDAIARAEQDVAFPIPVVLNLSSWSDPKCSIADWLQDEFSAKYSIPADITKTWVTEGKLLLLLDGLDEVKAENRETCIKAINRFRDDHGLLPLVVCCRVADYEALDTRLKLQGAILLKPLTAEQVEEYFENIGSELLELRQAVQDNPLLQQLVQTPLMLNIMIMAYTGNPTDLLVGEQFSTADAWRKHVFNTYTAEMFKRAGRTKNERFPSSQSMHWLTWLAQKMVLHESTVFLPEQMSWSWLSTSQQQRLYEFLSRLTGRAIGFAIGANRGLLLGQRFGTYWNEWVGSILGFLLGGVLGWWAYGLIFDVPAIIDTLKWSWKKALRGFVICFSLGLGLAIVGEWSSAFVAGLFGGGIGALFLGIRQLKSPFIWNWKFALVGLIVGVFVGMNLGALVWWKAGLFYGMLGLTLGINGSYMETITAPYQHLRLMLRNAFVLGIIFGLVFGILLGWLNGLWLGFMIWFLYGGDFLISHFLLRVFLYRTDRTPWNYVQFLDYAAERILLRKVGGGYIFIHRMLMEHFTELELARKVQFDKKNVWTIASYGETYWRMQQYEQALAEFDLAIQLDANNAQVFANRGRLYLEMRKFEQALADFDQAIRLKKDDAWAIWNRGITYRNMGKYEQALEDFNHAIQIGDTTIFASRGEVYRLMGKYEQALADFDHSIDHGQEYDWAYQRRGVTYHLIGKLDNAVADLSYAIELDPQDDFTYYLRSRIYKLQNHTEGFTADIKRAVQICQSRLEKNPKNVANLFDLALYKLIAGNLEEVERLYQECLASNVPIGLIQENINNLEEFYRFFPTDPKVQQLKERLEKRLSGINTS